LPNTTQTDLDLPPGSHKRNPIPQATALNAAALHTTAVKRVALNLRLMTVPENDPGFDALVSRTEEGLTRLAATKYWNAKMEAAQEDNENVENTGRRLMQSCPKKLNGLFTLRSVKCSRFLAFYSNCGDTSLRLVRTATALGRWRLNASVNRYGNIVANRSCGSSLLGSAGYPRLSRGASTWQYKLIRVSSCDTYTLMAKSSTGKGKYLSMNGDCTGFTYRTKANSNSRWTLGKSLTNDFQHTR
jgi:hypothetical protein